MREGCSAAILLTPKNVGPYGSLVLHFIMRLMGQFELIVPDKIGPPKGLRVIGYMLQAHSGACT